MYISNILELEIAIIGAIRIPSAVINKAAISSKFYAIFNKGSTIYIRVIVY